MRRNSLEIGEKIILVNSSAFPETFFSFSTARKGSEPARTSAERDARSTREIETIERLSTGYELLEKNFLAHFFSGLIMAAMS